MEFGYEAYLALLAICMIVIAVNRRHYPEYWLPWFLLVLAAFGVEFPKAFTPVHIDNLLNHLYHPLEITFMVLMYAAVLKNSWLARNKLVIIIGFWVIAMILSLFVEGVDNTNAYSLFIASVIIVVLVMAYFYRLYTHPEEEGHLLRNPFFWFNTANLFFYTGTYFFMALYELVENNEQTASNFDLITLVLNFMLYMLYIVGAICRMRAT